MCICPGENALQMSMGLQQRGPVCRVPLGGILVLLPELIPWLTRAVRARYTAAVLDEALCRSGTWK